MSDQPGGPGEDSRRIIAVDARPLSTPLSGVGRVIAQILLEYPDKEGTRFVLYSHRGWHPHFQEVVELPNVVWVTGRGPLARLGGLWFNFALPWILRKGRLHLFWGSQQVIPPFLPRKLPVVLTYYDLVLYFFPGSMRRIARWQQWAFQRYSVNRANRIISISNQTMVDMIEKFDYPPERASVALLGYTPPSSSGEVDKSVIPFKGPYIFSLSTLEPRKNYGTLLKAYEHYLKSEKEKPYPLVIAGKRGWETEEFYRHLDRLQKETGLVHIVEGANDATVQWLYQNQAFFCLPSLYEGFGLSLLESLCISKSPSLVSDIGSFHEIGGDRIRYLPPRDVSAWTGAILDFVGKHRGGQLKSVRFSSWEWSWERTAGDHRRVFEEVME